MTTRRRRAETFVEVPGEWFEQAACRTVDGGIFFPQPGDDRTAEAAKTVCRACTVAQACLEYALKNKLDDGIWGGHDEVERRRIRKRARRIVVPRVGPNADRCPTCRSRKFVSPKSGGKLECLSCEVTWYAAT